MGQDVVFPPFDRTVSFEAKYALDSLASFLRLSRLYYQETSDGSFLTPNWIQTLKVILDVVEEQSASTFSDNDGTLQKHSYSFVRPSSISTAGPYGGPESPPNGIQNLTSFDHICMSACPY